MRHVWLPIVFLLTACASQTTVISTDLTRQQGVYVIAYVDREEVRVALEDQMVADLVSHDMIALPSHPDIAKIKGTQPAAMVSAANKHEVAALIVINRVARDGSGSIIDSEKRITPANADLHQYYEATKGELDAYGQDDPVFAEVNAFYVDGRKTRRFWTGTSWTFAETQDEAIKGITETIAVELARVRDEIRSYDRPMN